MLATCYEVGIYSPALYSHVRLDNTNPPALCNNPTPPSPRDTSPETLPGTDSDATPE